MPVVEINYVAVLVAALVFMAVGFVWYSLAVFGKIWMREVGLTTNDVKKGPAGPGYAVATVAALVQAYVLAHFIDYTNASTWVDGLTTGLWIGVGFVAMAIAANYVFARRSAMLWMIDSGYFIVSLAISGALLAVWS